MARNFKIKYDPTTGEDCLVTSMLGKALMTIPQLNKGSAFTDEERWAFGLKGKLPFSVETIEQQADRCYVQYCRFQTDLEKNIYLKNLQATNETLFYYLVRRHLGEMLPIVYTPTVADAVKTYSLEYRRARGLFIAYPDRHRIPELLAHRTNPEIDIIVASDAEGVLGIGDQGVGGMDIPVAKLMVYTLCAGVNPRRFVPIFLDVGTNNEALLNDPMYLGWRHPRVSREEYDEMMGLFVEAVKDHLPGAFLHWEDFGRDNARRNLERFKDELCSFNDDMQGTAAVTISALMAAGRASGVDLDQQRIVVFGAGTAGVGIVDAICGVMQNHYGLSESEARSRFWLVDRPGLLIDDMGDLPDFQRPYVRARSEVKDWFKLADGTIEVAEVIRQAKPTTLIGCSTCAGAFSPSVLKAMAAHNKRPIIFPLSNPTALAEATPDDILLYTSGEALIATGSPFGTCDYEGQQRQIAQCNNALVFPGIGLGVVAVGASKLTDNMLWAACQQLSKFAPVLQDPYAPVLPGLDDALEVSKGVAIAVAKQAIQDGVATEPEEGVEACIVERIWEPAYYPYRLEAE